MATNTNVQDTASTAPVSSPDYSVQKKDRKQTMPLPPQYGRCPAGDAPKLMSDIPENKQASEAPMTTTQQAFRDGYHSKEAGPFDWIKSKLGFGAPAAKPPVAAAPAKKPAVKAPTAAPQTGTGVDARANLNLRNKELVQ